MSEETVLLITGAFLGGGQAIAAMLAQRDFSVFGMYRSNHLLCMMLQQSDLWPVP